MEDYFTMYKQQLLFFIQDGPETSLKHASTLVDEFLTRGVQLDEIIPLHLTVMRWLLVDVDLEEEAYLNDHSFFFLLQIILLYSLRINQHDSLRDSLVKLQQQLHKTWTQVTTYETILQNMDTSILIYDQQDFVSFVNINMGKNLGISRKEILGKNWRQLLAYSGRETGLIRLMQRICNDLTAQQLGKSLYEYTDQKQRYLHVNGSLTDTGDILISIRDLSDFKKMEQSAFHNEKLALLGKIAAGVAHEIRNPLTSVRGFIQLLEKDLVEMGREEYVKIILSELDRVNLIIQGFLSSSRNALPERTPVHMTKVLRDLVLLCQSEANLRNCEIISNIPDDLPTLKVDVQQIKQVLLNIIKNAFDAIEGKPGVIWVAAELEANRWLRITVRDNGKGMDQETMGHLFEPFFTTKEKGTGLGLAMCYRIIENHKGMIYADSQLGAGTTFTIKLPLMNYDRQAVAFA